MCDTRPFPHRPMGAYAGRRRRIAIADSVGEPAPVRGALQEWRGPLWRTLAHPGITGGHGLRGSCLRRNDGPRLRGGRPHPRVRSTRALLPEGEGDKKAPGGQRRPRAARIGAPQAGSRPFCASLPVQEVRGCEVPASARQGVFKGGMRRNEQKRVTVFGASRRATPGSPARGSKAGCSFRVIRARRRAEGAHQCASRCSFGEHPCPRHRSGGCEIPASGALA